MSEQESNEDILAKPSRRLDALVAEKVFGCNSEFGGTGAWCRCENGPHSKTLGLTLPYYSTSIEAAWEVVEKIGPIRTSSCTHDCFSLTHWPGEWEAEWGDIGAYSKHSAPHAICLAALRSTGYEV